jgi:hypothetical protein
VIHTHGAALYRAGRYEEALKPLAAFSSGTRPRSSTAPFNTYLVREHAFLAMAHHRLGHAKEAGEHLAEARKLAAAFPGDGDADREVPPEVLFGSSGFTTGPGGGSLGVRRSTWARMLEVRLLLAEAEGLINGTK